MSKHGTIYAFESDVSNAKKAKRVDMSLDVGTLPMYERADLFPASASAINKATEYNIKYNTQDAEDILKVDESSIRFNQACSNFRGARNIYQQDLPPLRIAARREVNKYKLIEDHYQNIVSEASRGMHGVNLIAKQSFHAQKVRTTGAGNNVKSKGFERDDNPKIYPRLPTALPMSVEPMRPTIDGIRINDTIVDPIAVFPRAGF